MSVAQRGQKRILNRVTECCKYPCRYWASHSGLLEQRTVFSTMIYIFLILLLSFVIFVGMMHPNDFFEGHEVVGNRETQSHTPSSRSLRPFPHGLSGRILGRFVK